MQAVNLFDQRQVSFAGTEREVSEIHTFGRTVNVGGGRECSLSLRETTAICQELTGNEVPIAPVEETRQGDVPIYLSDCTKLFGLDEWRPQRSAEQVLRDIHDWIAADEERIAQALEIDT